LIGSSDAQRFSLETRTNGTISRSGSARMRYTSSLPVD
jgi:hypothetical protein